MPAHKTVLVWVGLTRHHIESARGLSWETESLVSKLRHGICPMVGDLLLEPVGLPTTGFGVVIDRIETPLSPHQVRTKTDLATHYAKDIRRVRIAFKQLGFTRTAQLYVSTEERTE